MPKDNLNFHLGGSMTRQYRPEIKAVAMRLLAANRGNVHFTSLQTGIPESTLAAWQREQLSPQRATMAATT